MCPPEKKFDFLFIFNKVVIRWKEMKWGRRRTGKEQSMEQERRGSHQKKRERDNTSQMSTDISDVALNLQ